MSSGSHRHNPPAGEAKRPLVFNWRSKWRDRQDVEHHEEGETPPPVLSHPLVYPGEPTWVDSDEGVEKLAARLRQDGSFVFDTEFIGEDAYYPRVCLLQIGTEHDIWLVDPLAKIDLDPLWELVADPHVATTVHAGRQDLAFAFRAAGRAPADVFDTQIAAAFAGFAHMMGQGKLVEAALGADVGASAKFSRWDRRPLTLLQRTYAANDVRYLPAVRAMLLERLEKHGNLHFATAATEDAFSAESFTPPPPEGAVPIGRLAPRMAGAMLALVRLREELARREDLPPRILLSDDALHAVAQVALDGGRLEQAKGLPRAVREKHGEALVLAARSGAAFPPPKPPRRRGPTEKQAIAARVRADDLWKKVAQLCGARGIDPLVVTTRKEIHRLAVWQISKIEPVEPIRVLDGWRRELLGDLA